MAIRTAILVFLLGAQPAESEVGAMEAATRALIGPEREVRIEVAKTPVTEEELEALGAGVEGIVLLVWRPEANEVLLRTFLSRSGRWLDRRIRFDANDPESERARLIGLVVGAMFAEEAEEEFIAEVTEPQRQASPEAGDALPDLVQVSTSRAPPDVLRQEPRASRRGGLLELGGLATAGIGGIAQAFGGGVGIRRYWNNFSYARVVGSVRTGAIPAAESTATTYQAVLGVGLEGGDAWLIPGVRLGLVGGWFNVTHLAGTHSEPERQGRFVFGLDGALTGRVPISANSSLQVGVGVEALPGQTDIVVQGELAARVPRIRAVFELAYLAELF